MGSAPARETRREFVATDDVASRLGTRMGVDDNRKNHNEWKRRYSVEKMSTCVGRRGKASLSTPYTSMNSNVTGVARGVDQQMPTCC